MINANRYPSYCCQTCGEQIGWLGRALVWLRLPMRLVYGGKCQRKCQ